MRKCMYQYENMQVYILIFKNLYMILKNKYMQFK
jgi:hypothetical protein